MFNFVCGTFYPARDETYLFIILIFLKNRSRKTSLLLCFENKKPIILSRVSVRMRWDGDTFNQIKFSFTKWKIHEILHSKSSQFYILLWQSMLDVLVLRFFIICKLYRSFPDVLIPWWRRRQIASKSYIIFLLILWNSFHFSKTEEENVRSGKFIIFMNFYLDSVFAVRRKLFSTLNL